MRNWVGPEPESHDTRARVMESGESTQYRIISDIDINYTSVMTSQNDLPELGFVQHDSTCSDRSPRRGNLVSLSAMSVHLSVNFMQYSLQKGSQESF